MSEPLSSPADSKRASKRQALLRDSAAVFLEHGFSRTTMQQISEACGVGKGTLYEYFDSKEDLFLEMCLEELDVSAGAIDEAFTASGNALATLGEVFDRRLAEVPKYLARMPLYFTLWARLAFDDRFRDKCHGGVRRLYRAFREAVARGITRAQERGEIREDVDARDLATLLDCTLDGYTYLRVFGEADVDVERLERALRVVLFDGMKAPPKK